MGTFEWNKSDKERKKSSVMHTKRFDTFFERRVQFHVYKFQHHFCSTPFLYLELENFTL